ncbi:MAG: S-layer homology domain-containing protein, partial [Butyricicoccus sp.]
MKKRFLGGLLAMALLAGTCGAVFHDIQTPSLAQTAAVLKSLNIMEGDSAETFAPSRTLTRAEFAKLIVTAFGVTDVTAYKNFTVFPDVPNSHWAAGYINAAIKHPDIKEKKIIHGYADGTFQPNRTINYGEACTMLMLMLGYSIDDIGHVWPGDYIARAQAEGLADGASVMNAASPVSRADAAIMLLNA